MWILAALLFGVFVWLNFHSRRPALRVLMYHKLSQTNRDFLTITTEQLQAHLTHLRQANYCLVSLDDVLRSRSRTASQPLPPRAVLITFDDAYVNNYDLALPILNEFGVPATIFVPTAYIGGTNEWDGGTDPLMTEVQLKSLVNNGLTLAYHAHRHQNFKHLSPEQGEQDLTESQTEAQRLTLPLLPALAYPYGGRPKDRAARQKLVETMERLGIQAAFRIGNRINPLPLRNPFEINRIDVRGTDSMDQFKRKVKWGKLI